MKSFFHSRDRSSKAAALIICLAFVVLLTGLTLVFFSRASTDRQLAQSSFNDTKVDLLAQSALDIVIGDFKQEIASNPTVSSTNIQPTRYTPAPSPAATPIANLIRQSFSGDPTGRTSSVSSSAVSANGRSISTTRWNSHYLIPRGNPSDTSVNPSPTPSFIAPNWVLVTAQGPSPAPAPSTVIGRYAFAVYDEGGLIDVNVAGFPYATPSPAPTPPGPPQPIYAPSPPYAPGSYPPGYTAVSYTAQKLGRKGTAALADLSILPATDSTFFPTAQINTIVGWRNYASAQPGSDFSTGFTFPPGTPPPGSAPATRYYSAALSNFTSFLQTSTSVWNNRTDQAFVSRQEFLAFRTSTGFSQNLLQYLGTFSRELNRPSWKPATPTTINPDLNTISVIKRRFPLSRLCWVTYRGPSALRTMPPSSPVLPATDPDYDMWQLLYMYGVPQAYLGQGTAANIKAAFGLVWDGRTTTSTVGSQWIYTSPTSIGSGGTFDGTSGDGATAIKTLSTVQSESREPDFIELFKGVILNGSLGLGSGGANTFVQANPKYYDTTNGRSADCQIIQIAGNVIDDWDVDNSPTFVAYGASQGPAGFATQLVGVENLPYLNKIVYDFWLSNHGNEGDHDEWSAWLVPSLWNPHQNAASAPSTQDVRFVMTSGSVTGWLDLGNRGTFQTPTVTSTGTTPYIEVKTNQFATPYPPASSNENGTPPHSAEVGPVTEGPCNPSCYDGIALADHIQTEKQAYRRLNKSYPMFAVGTTFQMQVQVNGTWKSYQSWNGCSNGTSSPFVYSPGSNHFDNLQDPEFVSLDPRTVRFGVWGSDAGGANNNNDYTTGLELTMDENNGGSTPEVVTQLKPQPTSAFPTTGKTYLYSTNGTAGDQYADLDGVKRRGDWTTDASGTGNAGTIMYPANSADRPQILSAPFQSVAELGQVFRDQPWKTLNFTTDSSADSALLDAFTLQDAPMTAGRTSLNTRHVSVLKAILSQAALKLDGTSILSANQVTALATDIANITNLTPLTNKAELLAQLATKTSFTGLGNKEARECVMRALSDACQTRTWNLLIDVIAQTGRYAPDATNITQANKFVVEGERRYWLHVAIDRFTGQVVDKQTELVNE